VLPLLEVAVADGWRNRYMAPFYALIISFALVLLLGFSFREEPGTQNPEPKEKTTVPTATTPATAFSANSSEEFPGAEVTVVYGDEKKKVRDLGAIPTLQLTEKYAVCAKLDDGWAAVDATRAPDSDYSCWGPFDPKSGKPFVLRVEATE
jgi:hypothetical protein